ncbi:MAG: hypothetical protein QNJ89_05390 [Acidimicrobiia bacterium]|nr:hypothetical protein [Acidimicrobiia bacterium]
MSNWTRVGIVLIVLGALILVTGLLLPLTAEHDTLGSIECGTAWSVDVEAVAEESACEQAVTDRRTLVYLGSGFVAGIGLICLGLGSPPSADRRRRHPFF